MKICSIWTPEILLYNNDFLESVNYVLNFFHCCLLISHITILYNAGTLLYRSHHYLQMRMSRHFMAVLTMVIIEFLGCIHSEHNSPDCFLEDVTFRLLFGPG